MNNCYFAYPYKPEYQSKASFIKKFFADPCSIDFVDPSMLNHTLRCPPDSRPFSLSQATQPVNFIVTNHPKRSWFAEIYYDPSRKDDSKTGKGKGSIDGMSAKLHIVAELKSMTINAVLNHMKRERNKK